MKKSAYYHSSDCRFFTYCPFLITTHGEGGGAIIPADCDAPDLGAVNWDGAALCLDALLAGLCLSDMMIFPSKIVINTI